MEKKYLSTDEILIIHEKITKYNKNIQEYYEKINKLEQKLKENCNHKIKSEYNFNERNKFCEVCGTYFN